MLLKFQKSHGAGNDFVLIDNRSGEISLPANVIRDICHRRTGVGADGLIMLESSDIADVAMRYHNADGYPAEMCGNGARCAVDFAVKLGLGPSSLSLSVQGERLEAEWRPEPLVRMEMPGARIVTEHEGLERFRRQEFGEMLHLEAGVPHLVVAVTADLSSLDIAGLGRLLRDDPYFSPRGVNVNFVAPLETGRLRCRVYERGVEAETLACGTGGVACAVFAAHRWGWASPVEVLFPGGVLQVEFDDRYSRLFLSGPVQRVFEGTILIDG